MDIDTFVGLIALDPSTKRRTSSSESVWGRQDRHSWSNARMHRAACIHVRVGAALRAKGVERVVGGGKGDQLFLDGKPCLTHLHPGLITHF
jgi:hypothetical protein